MARNIELKPLSEVIAKFNAQVEKDIKQQEKWARERAAKTIKAIEMNRMAFALLDAAGFELNLPNYRDGSSYELNLGYFSRKPGGTMLLTNAIRKIRQALGCRLEQSGKDVADAKMHRVEYHLTPVDFPTIKIIYSRRIPAGAKCKIRTETSRYKTLVCEGL